MRKEVLWLIAILVLSIDLVSAAILHGSIYDSNLKSMNNVVVEVDSEPPQHFISKEGQYSFVLDVGNYTLEAIYESSTGEKWYVEKNISIQRNGYFVVDLLFSRAVKIQENREQMPAFVFYLIGLVIAVLVLVAVFFFVFNRKQTTEKETVQTSDEYTDQLLKIIKKEGGRTTQKDIRKQLPLSEGKVSLMISELEEKGILKRIKKGRGNIIILQK